MEKLCPAPLPSDTVQGTLPCANDRIGVVIGTKGVCFGRRVWGGYFFFWGGMWGVCGS